MANTKTQRTDPHRPGCMVPTEYSFVAAWFLDTIEDAEGNDIRERLEDVVDAAAYKDCPRFEARTSESLCDHCGTHNIRKGGIYLLHQPTGELVHVGADCYGKRFSKWDWSLTEQRARARSFYATGLAYLQTERPEFAEFASSYSQLVPQKWYKVNVTEDVFVLTGDLRRNRTRSSATAQHLAGELPFTGEDAIGKPRSREDAERDYYGGGSAALRRPWVYRKMARASEKVHGADASIYSAIRKLGELAEGTDRGAQQEQIARIERAIARMIEGRNEAREAWALFREGDPVNENAEPCPRGTVEITGEVLSTKLVESAYGCIDKMLVLDDRGFKVWGTSPSSCSIEKGDRVRFTATVEPKADDRAFGYYKRPRKAEVLTAQEVS